LTGASGATFLAFDFGSQSIGVAAGGGAGTHATPLTAIRVFRSGPDWDSIDKLVDDWAPAGLVVGLAYNSSGAHTVMSRRAAKFGRRLRERYNRPVHWVDETLTTEAARRALRESDPDRRPRKQDLDNTAAALILESFLNARQ